MAAPLFASSGSVDCVRTDFAQLKPSMRKLFVGGLAAMTTGDSLQRYFQQYGRVCDCEVIFNNHTGESLRYGFVRFCDAANIARVLKESLHMLDGRAVETKSCNQRPKHERLPRVFLGGLPSSVTESDLCTIFGRYGNVTKVDIIYDRHLQRPKGFGYILFKEEASVVRVIAERFVALNGKRVEVKRAAPRELVRCDVCMQPTNLPRNGTLLHTVPAKQPISYSAASKPF